jgi:predicted ribosomally synthesized peptide with nif11-like leader
MSEEQLNAFLEKVKADTSLQEKLKAAGDANTVAAIAKDAGFMVSIDELKQFSEISEEELEHLAGGGACGDSRVCTDMYEYSG